LVVERLSRFPYNQGQTLKFGTRRERTALTAG
jgi:hypothetical protein